MLEPRLSPGLCGCTAESQGRPCLQRRLYTSLGAGRGSGAASGPPWGTSAGSRWRGTRSLYKWAFVWCTRRTAGPGSRGEASWFEQKGDRSHELQKLQHKNLNIVSNYTSAQAEFRLISFRLHHDFGFFDEIVFRHGALFNHLNGHVVLALPLPVLHHSELTGAQLLDEGEVTGVDLPNTWRKQDRMRRHVNTCGIHFKRNSLIDFFPRPQAVWFSMRTRNKVNR